MVLSWPKRIALAVAVVAVVALLVVRQRRDEQAVRAQDREVLAQQDAERARDARVLTEPGATSTTERIRLQGGPWEAGTCLFWDQGADQDQTVKVRGCDEDHLFESVGPTTMPQPPGAPYPDAATWNRVDLEVCTPLAQAFLGARLDPHGRFGAGHTQPLPSSWDRGERVLTCGLQLRSNTPPIAASRGRIADTDQSVVYPPGTCLGDQVVLSCDQPHLAEVVGTATLTTAEFPTDEEWKAMVLTGECARQVTAKLGHPANPPASYPSLLRLRKESWDAGSRLVPCLVARSEPAIDPIT
jgi:hypothetical protein